MSTEAQELLQLQTNANEETSSSHNSSEELYYRQQIPETPFWIVGDKSKGYFLVMGQYQMTEYFQTPEEVEEHFKSKQWELILTMITIVFEELNKTKNQ